MEAVVDHVHAVTPPEPPIGPSLAEIALCAFLAFTATVVLGGCTPSPTPEVHRGRRAPEAALAGARDHSGTTALDRCSPFAAVCGAESEADRERIERLRRIREAITREAGESAHDRPDLASVRDPSRHQRLIDKERRVIVLGRVEPLRSRVERAYERVRRSAIERALDLDLDESAIARLRASELRWIDLDSIESAELPRPLRIGCGEDLLLDDGWVDKQARVVTLCPGLLLASCGPHGSCDELEDRIAFMLAHEIGHVIVGPTGGARAERAAELQADRWAAFLLGHDLEARPPSSRAAFLRRALEPICYPESDPIHPAGADRVMAMAAEPAIASALGCSGALGTGALDGDDPLHSHPG